MLLDSQKNGVSLRPLHCIMGQAHTAGNIVPESGCISGFPLDDCGPVKSMPVSGGRGKREREREEYDGGLFGIRVNEISSTHR